MVSVDIVKFILNLIYPKKCFSCGKSKVYFCNFCLKNLKEPPYFYLNGLDNLIIGGSTKNQALFKAIKFLKYYGVKEISPDLGWLLSQRIKEKIPDYRFNTILVPIPLFFKRERPRGFNQAELLARVVSENLNVPLRNNLLERTKDTSPQAKTKSRRERFDNIKNSFKAIPSQDLENSRVILVDDIMTTGATLSEAARILKKAGAKIVIGLVVAKG